MAGLDFAAFEVHFLDHLAPVWHELDEEHRGTFYARGPDVAERALELGIPTVAGDPPRSPDPIVVASYGDLRIASRSRLRVAYFEHGSGQSYGSRHSSYAGGIGRDRVKLFLCPNELVAAANRRRYPSTPAIVIGSPHVDELARIPPVGGSDCAAISFHWRCKVAPEADTALDHYAAGLAELRLELEGEGIELIGHGHPRIMAELEPIYRAAGIEPVASFVDVVARADLYAVDNSSTLFEFAALDRPVVVLNAPGYRRNVELGLRFWTEADVGRQVDQPGDLAAAVVEALEDPPELAASRRAAVARVYAVTDGSSSARAASALLPLLGFVRCLVCGDPTSSCGGSADHRPVDEFVERDRVKSKLRRYPNPAKPGAFLRLSDAEARFHGFTDADAEELERPRPAPAVDAVTHAPDPSSSTPKGALQAGGPTARARAAAQAVDPSDSDEKAPVSDPEPVPAPDAPEGVPAEPGDKARPAPRRRRKAAQ